MFLPFSRIVRTIVSVVAFSVTICCFGGVVVKWTTETSEIEPQEITLYRGETARFEATMLSYSKKITGCSETCEFLWQTNGMGNAWWTTNGTFRSSVACVMFAPEMDPGGDKITFFFRVMGADGANYRANGSVEFLGSPGAKVNHIAPPVVWLNFNDFTVTNAPYFTKGESDERYIGQSRLIDTNTVRRLIDESFAGGTQKVNRVIGSFDVLSNQVAEIEGCYASTGYVDKVVDEATNGLASVNFVTNALTGYATTNDFASATNEMASVDFVTNASVHAVTSMVPAWARTADKPVYTAEEVGARGTNWVPTLTEVIGTNNVYDGTLQLNGLYLNNDAIRNNTNPLLTASGITFGGVTYWWPWLMPDDENGFATRCFVTNAVVSSTNRLASAVFVTNLVCSVSNQVVELSSKITVLSNDLVNVTNEVQSISELICTTTNAVSVISNAVVLATNDIASISNSLVTATNSFSIAITNATSNAVHAAVMQATNAVAASAWFTNAVESVVTNSSAATAWITNAIVTATNGLASVADVTNRIEIISNQVVSATNFLSGSIHCAYTNAIVQATNAVATSWWYTNDLTVVGVFAVTNSVDMSTNWVAKQEYVTDSVTNGVYMSLTSEVARLDLKIENATPGNYEIVSNRAMNAVTNLSGYATEVYVTNAVAMATNGLADVSFVTNQISVLSNRVETAIGMVDVVSNRVDATSNLLVSVTNDISTLSNTYISVTNDLSVLSNAYMTVTNTLGNATNALTAAIYQSYTNAVTNAIVQATNSVAESSWFTNIVVSAVTNSSASAALVTNAIEAATNSIINSVWYTNDLAIVGQDSYTNAVVTSTNWVAEQSYATKAFVTNLIFDISNHVVSVTNALYSISNEHVMVTNSIALVSNALVSATNTLATSIYDVGTNAVAVATNAVAESAWFTNTITTLALPSNTAYLATAWTNGTTLYITNSAGVGISFQGGGTGVGLSTNEVKGIVNSEVGGTNSIVHYEKSRSGNYDAITVGTRRDGQVGQYSIAIGSQNWASSIYSFTAGSYNESLADYATAVGYYCQALRPYSFAFGMAALTYLKKDFNKGDYSFVWNPYWDGTHDGYYAHGDGTFNVNPFGGIAGFYIGETNLSTYIPSTYVLSANVSNNTLYVTNVSNGVKSGFSFSGGGGGGLDGLTATNIALGVVANYDATNITARIDAKPTYQDATNAAKRVFSDYADYELVSFTNESFTVKSGQIAYASVSNNATVTLDYSTASTRSGDCLAYLECASSGTVHVALSPGTGTLELRCFDYDALDLEPGDNLLTFTRIRSSGGVNRVLVVRKPMKYIGQD